MTTFNPVPDDVIQASQVIGKWAAENNVRNWAVGDCAARTFREILLDLLATIHRDGGHYTSEHGIDKSVKDAVITVSALHLRDLNEEFGCWEPMHSAPRNRPVLIRTDNGEAFVAQWATHPVTDDVAWRVAVFGNAGECLIVHDPIAWHELPAFGPRPDSPERPDDGALDAYHWHEVTDRAHCIRQMVDSMLADHKAVMLSPSLRSLVSMLDTLLGEIYQDAGRRY